MGDTINPVPNSLQQSVMSFFFLCNDSTAMQTPGSNLLLHGKLLLSEDQLGNQGIRRKERGLDYLGGAPAIVSKAIPRRVFLAPDDVW